MNFLEIQPTTVHLIGLSRSAHFKIKNKNHFLAISYEFVKKSDDYEQQLQIFPEKGILLRGQQQKIRIKPYHNSNDSTLEEILIKIQVKYTFKMQYNKQSMIKNNINGWNELSDEVYRQEIMIISGGERQIIEKYIKQEIVFNKAFAPSQLNISEIKHNNNEYYDKSSLDIQSKICYQIKNANQSIVKPYNVNNSQVSINIDNLLPLDFGESRASPFKEHNKLASYNKSLSKIQKEKLVESKMVQHHKYQEQNDKFMRTAQSKEFLLDDSFIQKVSSVDRKQNKAFDMILLAIISAFFVALGNNIGRLFK